MDLWTRDTQYDTICMHLKRKYNERFFDTVVWFGFESPYFGA